MEADAGEQALAGLRVVEFTAGMAGPWIGRFMAYCGAEVIRVESRKHPGVVRLYVPPWDREGGVQEDLSPWFTDWEAGKRFVSLDLSRPEAVDLAKRLVARADVVVENQSTGVMTKLGLDYEVLREINPSLIFFSSNGFGQSGPCARYVTWGPNIEALSGLSSLSGPPERECANTQYAYPDSLSAMHGLFAVLCALDHRERTGEGQRITLSQFEATVGMIGPQMMEQLASGRAPARLGNRSDHAAPHGCYPCRGDDRWCVITVFDDSHWHGLCEVMGASEWGAEARFADTEGRRLHADEIDARIAAYTGDRTPHEVMAKLQARNIPAGAVQDTADQLERDPHLATRGYFERIPHLRKGEVLAPGIPLGLTETPGRTWRAGGRIGQDDDYVFGELLGLRTDELRRLRAVGAVESPQTRPDD